MVEKRFDPQEYGQLKRQVAQEVIDMGAELINKYNLTPDDNGFYHVRILMDIKDNPDEERFVQNCGVLYREFIDGVGFVDDTEEESDSDDGSLSLDEIMAKPYYRSVIWNPEMIQEFLDSST